MSEWGTHLPLKLVKNVTYPSYQLWAIASNTKTPPQEAMKITVLTVMAWLRERFRELPVPQALQTPDAAQYKEISLSDFPSIHINEGYTVDIVSLPEEQVWALQLLEPDLGSEPGNPNQLRKPVPGRLFETNIGFRISGNRLECGFKTMVAQPEQCKEACEAFRLAVIKLLVTNPLVGLRHAYPILRQVHKLDTMSQIRQLKNYLKQQTSALPVVVFIPWIDREKSFLSECAPEQFLAQFQESKCFQEHFIQKQTQQVKSKPLPEIPYDTRNLAYYKMGYAHFFHLHNSCLKEYQRVFSCQAHPGDVFLLEPEAFGGKITRFPYTSTTEGQRKLIWSLEQQIQDYPQNKPVHFGNILFVKQAKLLGQDKLLQSRQSMEERVRTYGEHEELLNQEWQEKLREKEALLTLQKKKNQRLQERISQYDSRETAFRAECVRNTEKLEKRLHEQEEETSYYKSLLSRPERTAQIPSWVEQRFSGRMLFHSRAKDLICATPTSEVDMKLLCDALEYLATDYRDSVEGIITHEELLHRCAQKYNRPFDVSSVGTSTIEFTPMDYKIKYYIGAKGKPVESPLNLHLRVGNDPENLLRIYFLYDKEKRLVVVGSLPKHLRAVQIK